MIFLTMIEGTYTWFSSRAQTQSEDKQPTHSKKINGTA
jgi:hypothetical protein